MEVDMRSRGHLVVIAGLALAVVSCGGSDDPADSNASADAAQTTDVESSTSEAGETSEVASIEVTDSATSPPAGEGDAGTGVIVIGDLRHDLTIVRCVTLAGAIGADAVSVSEPDNVDVSFSFSPEDWQERDPQEGWTDTGTVRLNSDDPYQQWEAGASAFDGLNLPEGTTADDFDITSLDISDDSQSAQGEANFVEINAMFADGEAVPTPGSFEFTCPQE